MKYVVRMYTDLYEWAAIGDTEASAKQAIFSGFNAQILRGLERDGHIKTPYGAEVTYEAAQEALKEYYEANYDYGFSVDSLDTAYGFEVYEMEDNTPYRDGHKVPK